MEQVFVNMTKEDLNAKNAKARQYAFMKNLDLLANNAKALRYVHMTK